MTFKFIDDVTIIEIEEQSATLWVGTLKPNFKDHLKFANTLAQLYFPDMRSLGHISIYC